MDRDAIEYTRQHYDAHANTMSMAEALRSRAEGAALPLKQYHNAIKRELINAFAGGPGATLLDLACGRGGDVWKWMDAGLSYVLGVDLSPGEVAEAARRFAEAREKRARSNSRGNHELPSGLVAEFRECSTLGLEPFSAEPPAGASSSDAAEAVDGGDGNGAAKRKKEASERGEGGKEEQKKKKKTRRRKRRRFDSVSCMFAAHYFCSSDAALSTFLANVARNLRPGGFFFGTVPSGKKVMAAIKEGGQWPLLSTPMLRLEAKWKGAPLPFGCGYTCAIGNTVTSTAANPNAEEGNATATEEGPAKNKDEATEQGSYEYLVFSSAFSAIAARHGLSPFPRWSGAPTKNPGAATAVERLLDPADEQAHFKSFAPHFPGSDPSLERASELFQAFVFVKDADKGGEEEFVEVEEGVEEEAEEEAEVEEEEEEKDDEEGAAKRRKL